MVRTLLFTLFSCLVLGAAAVPADAESGSAKGVHSKSRASDADQPDRMTVPEELSAWGFLVGRWDVESTRHSFAGEVIEENHGRAEFSWALDGRRLQERQSTTLAGRPMEVLRLFAVHPETRQWQVAHTDSLHDTFNVQAGTSEDHTIVLYERDPSRDSQVTRRWRYEKLSEDLVSLVLEFSTDQGQSFFVRNRTTYTRQRAD